MCGNIGVGLQLSPFVPLLLPLADPVRLPGGGSVPDDAVLHQCAKYAAVTVHLHAEQFWDPLPVLIQIGESALRCRLRCVQTHRMGAILVTTPVTT